MAGNVPAHRFTSFPSTADTLCATAYLTAQTHAIPLKRLPLISINFLARAKRLKSSVGVLKCSLNDRKVAEFGSFQSYGCQLCSKVRILL